MTDPSEEELLAWGLIYAGHPRVLRLIRAYREKVQRLKSMCWCNCGHCYDPDLRERAERAEAENAELEQVFELQHSRSIEAVKLWRAAHPGNDLVLPDLWTLWTWVLDRITALEKDARRLEGIIGLSLLRGDDYGDDPYFALAEWPTAWIVTIGTDVHFEGATAREAIDAAVHAAGSEG